MPNMRSSIIALAVLSCMVVGCAPPVVSVRHVMPGALPLPGDIARARAGTFTIRSGPKGDFAAFMQTALDEHLRDAPVGLGHTGRSSEITEARIARVGGAIDIETKDLRGRRPLRRLNRETGGLDSVEVPTLIRTASVRVDFEVRRAGGERLGAAEVRRSYNSAADVEVRGELGLRRPDDPDHVPPAEKIVKHLLTECIRGLGGMISPVEVAARVALRPAGGRSAGLGFAAAAEGDCHEAVGHFQAAVKAAPDDANLHFDLAAAAEAAGKLDLAAAHYRKAWELSGRKDAEAQLGAARVRRVLAATQPANARP